MDKHFDLLIAEIRRDRDIAMQIQTDIKQINHDISDIRVEIASLKTSSRIWGALAGTIPAVIAIAISFYK